jgi:hypothetical protein
MMFTEGLLNTKRLRKTKSSPAQWIFFCIGNKLFPGLQILGEVCSLFVLLIIWGSILCFDYRRLP